VKLFATGMLAAAAAALSGCTAMQPATDAGPAGEIGRTIEIGPITGTGPAASPARYRCEHDIEFTVRFVEDSAIVDAGPRGNDVLLRDAGGTAPQQTVYSNPRMRAEFGLGASGREAILRYAVLPLVAHCVRD
jgi:hypothetical protein